MKKSDLEGVFSGNLAAFPITGNSMSPVINNGDVVVCRECQLSDIEDNAIYAFKTTNGETFVKYLQRGVVGGKIRAISANYLEYDPFELEVKEVRQFFKVIRRVTTISADINFKVQNY